ncbi:MAG: HAD-IC family P-type ATPase [Alphaproteobacteria bacterium]|nr:HAD-IC family P-type ATPase [Alphaproteobacteria bacterium]
MGLRDRITALSRPARGVVDGVRRRIRDRGRRHWSSPERLWVETRSREPGHLAALIAHLERQPGVRWARYNAAFARLVVCRDAGGPTDDALIGALAAMERELGVGSRAFPRPRPTHPGDPGSEERSWVRAGASLGSAAVGASLRLAGSKPVPAEIDLAALTQALENMPQVRSWLDDKLGGSASDFGLGLASTVSSGLAHGFAGQVVDAVYRGLRLQEITAARQAWEAREAELAGSPDDHPPLVPTVGPREAHLPEGPIERWSEQASVASLGGFGFGVAASGAADKAAASIFGVVPKPARVGREAFAAVLGTRLAHRGFVILDDRPLRRLDRIDAIVLPEALLRPSQGELEQVLPVGRARVDKVRRQAHQLFRPEAPLAEQGDANRAWHLLEVPLSRLPRDAASWAKAQRGRGRWVFALREGGRLVALAAVRPIVDQAVRALVAASRSNGFKVVAAVHDPASVSWFEPDEILVPGADTLPAIRTLQRHGHGVAVVALGSDPALAAADVGIALHRPGEPPPWQAHIIGGPSLDDLLLVLEAMKAARKASAQSTTLAMAEAMAGLTLSFDGQRRSVIERVVSVSGGVALAAIGNGARIARSIVPPHAGTGPDRTPWHALEPDEALERIGSTLDGLAPATVAERTPPKEQQRSTFDEIQSAVWTELATPFAPILATGAGLSALMGSTLDASMVAATVLASGMVGGVQRVRAERATRALAERRQVTIRVRRGKREVRIPENDVVRGDILLLEAGDRVPADCRILACHALEVDESSLTGESVPVAKAVEPCFAGSVAERTSMLFADTTIAAGEATAVAVAVGPGTESRRADLDRPLVPPPTGVQARLESLTDLTTPVAGLAGVAVVASGLARRRPPRELVDTAVSLAVAAVPETLPLLATAAQLAAARRLSEVGALVRNPRSVEALGRVDVLCADKTGTLTEGQLRLQQVADAEGAAPIDALDDARRAVLAIALAASPAASDQRAAHPTDHAIHEGAAKAGVAVVPGRRVRELPFEPRRGYHATLLEDDGHRICVKGAPEVVIPRCDRTWDGDRRHLDDAGRDALLEASIALASQGLRVLAVAERPARSDALAPGKVRRLVFRGFVALADPVRPAAPDAVASLRAAGVEVKMITGDHPATASAIARQLGLAHEGVATGPELDALSDDELDALLPETAVFARVTPAQKVRIVEGLQRLGRVVAMTGDGANDAPAIRLADVGIAIGSRATAAARGAADVLVTDERIETLVQAVLEGRALWVAVRDGVSILVGGNLGEIGFTLFGGLLEGTSPLNPRQLMLVNLLTDALPALTVAVQPPDPSRTADLLGEGPDTSLGTALDDEIAWRALVTALSATLAWAAARPAGRERAATVALLSLVGAQLGQTLWVGRRSPAVRASVIASAAALLGIVQTPGLSSVAGSRVLGPIGLGSAAAATVAATLAGAALPALAKRQGWEIGPLLEQLRQSGEPGEPSDGE